MSSEKPQVKAFAVLQRTEEESGKKREKHSSMEHSGKFDVKNFLSFWNPYQMLPSDVCGINYF